MSVEAPNQALVGTVLGGRYRITRMIAAGGMGAVYEAEQIGLERSVAVKVMHPFLSEDDDSLIRFEREARAVARLEHPNIVRVLDFHRAPKELAWIVMELVPGVSLSQVIKTGGPVGVSRAIAITLPLLDALDAVHAAGLIHRDLKPSNVMLATAERGEVPKLVDFGITKIMEGDGYVRLTKTGIVLGTPQYMAPEHARGEEIDARADLYALGVILYAMLTGVSPFRGRDIGEVLRAVLDTDPPPPSALRPEVPAAVDRVVMRAIAKRAVDRFASAREMAAALQAAVAVAVRSVDPLPVTLSRPSAAAPATATAPAPAPGRASAPKSGEARALPIALWLGIGALAMLLAVVGVVAVGFVATQFAAGEDEGTRPSVLAPSPFSTPSGAGGSGSLVRAPGVVSVGVAPPVAPASSMPPDAVMSAYLAEAQALADARAPSARVCTIVGSCIDAQGRLVSNADDECAWIFIFGHAAPRIGTIVIYRNPSRSPVVAVMDDRPDDCIVDPTSLLDSNVAVQRALEEPRCAQLPPVLERTQLVYGEYGGRNQVIVRFEDQAGEDHNWISGRPRDLQCR